MLIVRRHAELLLTQIIAVSQALSNSRCARSEREVPRSSRIMVIAEVTHTSSWRRSGVVRVLRSAAWSRAQTPGCAHSASLHTSTAHALHSSPLCTVCYCVCVCIRTSGRQGDAAREGYKNGQPGRGFRLPTLQLSIPFTQACLTPAYQKESSSTPTPPSTPSTFVCASLRIHYFTTTC